VLLDFSSYYDNYRARRSSTHFLQQGKKDAALVPFCVAVFGSSEKRGRNQKNKMTSNKTYATSGVSKQHVVVSIEKYCTDQLRVPT